MLSKLFKYIKNDLFFIFAAHLSLLAGSVLAGFRSGGFNRLNLILGIGTILLAFLLKALLDHLTTNKINPYTKINLSRQDNKSGLILLTVFLFMALFSILFLLLRQRILIGVNLFYIITIFALFFLPVTVVGKVFVRKYDLFLEAIVVSPLFFLFGMGLQHENPVSYDFLMALPLFFCYMATAIAFNISDIEKGSALYETGMIGQLGWENAFKLHNFSILLTYIPLFLYQILTKTFALYWPVLISSVMALFEIFLLSRILLGVKPNWNFIRMTALLHYFTIIYILIYPMI